MYVSLKAHFVVSLPDMIRIVELNCWYWFCYWMMILILNVSEYCVIIDDSLYHLNDDIRYSWLCLWVWEIEYLKSIKWRVTDLIDCTILNHKQDYISFLTKPIHSSSSWLRKWFVFIFYNSISFNSKQITFVYHNIIFYVKY